jgi:predicted transcriptional regulator
LQRRASEQCHTRKATPVTGDIARRQESTGQVAGQVAGQVDPWVFRVLSACEVQPLKSREIQIVAGLKHRESFQRNYLDELLREGWLERTIPDKPKSRLQKYRLTDKGKALLVEIRNTGPGA